MATTISICVAADGDDLVQLIDGGAFGNEAQEELRRKMTLTRRHVGGESGRSSSIWEQEADDYWKEMEPAKRYKKISGYVRTTLLGLVLLGGATMIAQTVWNNVSMSDLAALKEKYFTLPAVNVTVDAVAPVRAEIPVPASTVPASAVPPPTVPAPTMPTRAFSEKDAAAIDLLRAKCRVRGVQTRWHEENCRKLCIRDPQNAACMNGCSFGSITVTKATCDQLAFEAIPTAQQCPDGVNCVSACKAYENEAPIPAVRTSCERACTNIVPSSCSRILQIYRDLYKGTFGSV
ncbi:hypothetical protein Poli38472_006963 [Pythium oligandrum]|uniref:Uncharacterized protein n=1 Tax=Pythium oligandrum TaxID=41045 RepID=A0A8K1C9C6_PYTOL|nr:hypothetical protein Poli38472_006963 [Pythium oligandrum]|eukprot:TMW58818.1 hypothetical protein Poli38472_006963 [Pythium oligandrum]